MIGGTSVTFVDRDGWGYLTPGRVLTDGRVVDVMPLTFGRARLLVSESASSQFVSDSW